MLQYQHKPKRPISDGLVSDSVKQEQAKIHERIQSAQTAGIAILRLYKIGFIASARYGSGIVIARLPNSSTFSI